MKKLTQDEINIICIYDTSNKNALIGNMQKAVPYIEDTELKQLTESAVSKLSAMTDSEFAATEFTPSFTAEDMEESDNE